MKEQYGAALRFAALDRAAPDPLWKREPDLSADESAAERYLGCGTEPPEAPW